MQNVRHLVYAIALFIYLHAIQGYFSQNCVLHTEKTSAS